MGITNYSGFVVISKIICILFAIIIAFSTVILSVYGSTSKQVKIDLIIDNITPHKEKFILKPTFYSINANKETFYIKASKAKEQGSDTVLLEQVKGHLTTKDNKSFDISSKNGTWLQNSKILELTGTVNFLHDDGIITSDTATIDINNHTVSSNQDTKVTNHAIHIESKGFMLLQQEKKVIFNGPVKTILFNNQAQ